MEMVSQSRSAFFVYLLFYFTLIIAEVTVCKLFFSSLFVRDSDETISITNRTDYFTL
jgi:positive regulator of sigma E activity